MTVLPIAMQFIFGTDRKVLDTPAQIVYLFGEYCIKEYSLGSYSVMETPVIISRLERKKPNKDKTNVKIRVQFYYMTKNPSGLDQFKW